jgi:uncharacterized YccA/Bax inhibitor family protein
MRGEVGRTAILDGVKHVSSLGNLKTGNPAFTMAGNVFDDWAIADRRSTSMTVSGTATKALGLMVVLTICAAISWNQVTDGTFSTGTLAISGIVGFVIAMVTAFKPTWAPFTSPVYAACQGFFLGALSNLMNMRFPGIAAQAVGLTFATAFGMMFLYSSRIIRVTEGFKRAVIAATFALCAVYLVTFLLRMFGVEVPYIHSTGGNPMIGIGISLVCVGLAAMNLLLDFDFIESHARAGSPKSMEWYGAFGLMVTLVWLYIELLRLLAKLSDRR